MNVIENLNRALLLLSDSLHEMGMDTDQIRDRVGDQVWAWLEETFPVDQPEVEGGLLPLLGVVDNTQFIHRLADAIAERLRT